MLVDKPCKYCGTMMYKVPHQRLCCRECLYSNEAKRAKESTLAGKKRNAKNRAEQCRKTLNEILVEAAKEGLSYGKYISKQEVNQNGKCKKV